MPFKTSIAASAVAALALAQTTLAAPVSSEASEPQCVSLGKGAFGFNSSAIGAATDDPPAIYLTVDTNEQNRIVASDKPVYEVQALFEFFNCSSVTTPAADGSGTVQTYQGYIKAPNGQCVTLSPDQVGCVRTSTCSSNSDPSLGICRRLSALSVPTRRRVHVPLGRVPRRDARTRRRNSIRRWRQLPLLHG